MDVLESQPSCANRRFMNGGPFTTSFSVASFGAIQQAGFEILNQVVGVSVMKTGGQTVNGLWLRRRPYQNAGEGLICELTTFTSAFNDSLRLATERLREEAIRLGASLVLDLKLTRRLLSETSDKRYPVWEFCLQGTALRAKDEQRPSQKPVLSNLSAIEFLQMRQSGFEPMGTAVAACNLIHLPTRRSKWLLAAGGWAVGGRNNQELPDLTRAIYEARRIAIGRLKVDDQPVKAGQILGLKIEKEILRTSQMGFSGSYPGEYGLPPIIIQFFAVGTAVRQYAPIQPVEADPTVSLGT